MKELSEHLNQNGGGLYTDRVYQFAHSFVIECAQFREPRRYPAAGLT